MRQYPFLGWILLPTKDEQPILSWVLLPTKDKPNTNLSNNDSCAWKMTIVCHTTLWTLCFVAKFIPTITKDKPNTPISRIMICFLRKVTIVCHTTLWTLCFVANFIPTINCVL